MFDIWRSGFIRRPLSSFIDHEPRADEIVWLPECGPHAYVADPFGITRDGVLTGHNTDATGFATAYRALGRSDGEAPVAIIGTGGVGKAIGFALAGCGVSVHAPRPPCRCPP